MQILSTAANWLVAAGTNAEVLKQKFYTELKKLQTRCKTTNANLLRP
jgi:hypothetical protein